MYVNTDPVTREQLLPVIPHNPHSSTSQLESEITDSDSASDMETAAASKESKDPDYIPPAGSSLSWDWRMDGNTHGDYISPDLETKFLVFESSLRELFRFSPCCGSQTVTAQFITLNTGALLKVKYTCSQGHDGLWMSQPLLKHGMAAGNLLLSAAILFTGNTYERFRELADVLHMPIMCENHFYSVQNKYLFPVAHSICTRQKEALIAALGNDPVTLVGDGRCDSPGFSAKYGTYNVMESATGALVTFALTQVNANTSSVAMEVNGCSEAISELMDHGMNIEVFGTDCSTSVAKLLRESFPDVLHEHDVYHIEKRIRKKLLKKANQRGNNALHSWIKPVVNQLWWVAQNCNKDPVELREKWISTIYHVTNQHEWDHFDLYHKCAHDALSPEDRRKKKWLKADSPAHVALKQVVLENRLVMDIKKITRAVHTGGLEVFHSLINKYCPKRQHFSYKGMIARTELAVLDHNHNIGRAQATTKEGLLRYDVVFPKRTKEWVGKPISEPKSHIWRLYLIKEVLSFHDGKRTAEQIPVPEAVPKNIAYTPRPPKEDVIKRHRSRFAIQHDILSDDESDSNSD
jgi:hypothetical protein